jgi:tetratricopeptide (TPR) repeat protein
MTIENKNREERVIEYRRRIDEIYLYNSIEEANQLIADSIVLAANAGDVDYRLLFEVEKIDSDKFDFARQMALVEQALEWNKEQNYPEDLLILFKKADVLSKNNDNDAAFAITDYILSINPNEDKALYLKGIYYAKKQEEDKAIEYYNQALAINPENFNALRQVGVSYINKGDLDTAIIYFDKALLIHPQNIKTLHDKGVAFSDKNDINVAIDLYNQALVIDPNDYKSLRDKGIALNKIGKIDEALVHIDMALAINPDDDYSYANKAILESNRGNYESCTANIIKAVLISPERWHNQFQIYCKIYNKDFKTEWEKLFPDDKVEDEWFLDIRLFLEKLMKYIRWK